MNKFIAVLVGIVIGIGAGIAGYILINRVATGQKTAPVPMSESDATSSTKDVAEKPRFLSSEQPITDCAFWKDRPFSEVSTDLEGDDAAGTVALSGTLATRQEEASFVEDGSEVTQLYFVIPSQQSEPQSRLYHRYDAMVKEGNSVNRSEGENVLFNLGTVEQGKLTTTAKISDALATRLLTLANTPTTISLTLTVPIYGGRGVSDSFSFACEITES